MTAHTIGLNSVHYAIKEFGDNPSGFLALNTGNQHFSVDGLSGTITYRQSGRFLVQFGGPFAAQADYQELLRRFLVFAQDQDCGVVAIQLQRADAEIYAEHGFTVNQVGASYAVRLAEFTTHGTQFMQLRNKIARAHRSGLTVIEARLEDWSDAVHEVDQVWLTSKGEHAKPLEFLVGEYGGPMQEFRRLYLGLQDDKPVGYISHSPVYGSRSGCSPGKQRSTGTRAVAETADRGLRRSLTTSKIVLLVVAAVAPLSAMVGTVPLAFAVGDGAEMPGMFVVAGVVLLCFSVGCAAISRRAARRRRLPGSRRRIRMIMPGKCRCGRRSNASRSRRSIGCTA